MLRTRAGRDPAVIKVRLTRCGRAAATELSMNQPTPTRKVPFKVLPILAAVSWIVLLAAPVAASSPGEEQRPERRASEAASAEAATSSVVANNASRVVVDPETGEIVARLPLQKTDGLSAPLARALSQSTDGLHVFELANGGRGVHLDGRFQHVLMVRVKADGSLETACVNHAHEAEKFLKRNAAEADMRPREK